MSKTLVLLFHPDITHSRANAALRDAVTHIAGIEIVDMQQIYPSAKIDADVEVQRLLTADRIVLQFPVQWYSTPALLRSWQDAVFTRMYYLAYAQEGSRFEGTPLMVAATAGNRPEAYSEQGANLFALEDLLHPLQATAHRCSLPWTSPFLLYNANQLDDESLANAGKRYAARLQSWIAETPAGVGRSTTLR